jgi:hypothetical protein
MCVRDIQITLVDDTGYVVSFVKRSYRENGVWTSDEWGLAARPRSVKVLVHPDTPRLSDTDTPEKYLKQLADGRRVLEVPYKAAPN